MTVLDSHPDLPGIPRLNSDSPPPLGRSGLISHRRRSRQKSQSRPNCGQIKPQSLPNYLVTETSPLCRGGQRSSRLLPLKRWQLWGRPCAPTKHGRPTLFESSTYGRSRTSRLLRPQASGTARFFPANRLNFPPPLPLRGVWLPLLFKIAPKAPLTLSLDGGENWVRAAWCGLFGG